MIQLIKFTSLDPSNKKSIGTYEDYTINYNFAFTRIYIRQHPLPPLGKRGKPLDFPTICKRGQGVFKLNISEYSAKFLFCIGQECCD